jgi:DmsE family decaheme c-type cytochrome
MLAMVGVVSGVLCGFGASGRADDRSRDDSIAELRSFVRLIATAEPATTTASARVDRVAIPSDPITELRNYVRLVSTAQPDTTATEVSRGEFPDNDYAALRAFVQGINVDPPPSTKDGPKLAAADNAFDALREFFRKQNGTAPLVKMPVPPPISARVKAPVIESHVVGSKICFECHSNLTAYDYTLMGRLQKQGKIQCETCHGPGSAHIQAVGCAACHGDGGITRRPGIPNLVGLDAPYLVTAMKAYVTGQRKYPLHKTLLSGMGDAEFRNIALYYARQPSARAQTPLIGEPSAGKSPSASCADCHGEQGVTPFPEWPSLAGQDAQYLANATNAYKNGSRSKAIACAACHGEGGISKRPGTPSLVGQDPQYLVAAMKAYVNGERKYPLHKTLFSGMGDAELNSIASFYAQQTPTRAQTPLVGDPSAGKTASAACADCHGQQGVSPVPEWPSLAGQEAQYLADATKAYKDGSRSKAVACAPCHGEGGVTKRPGIPSLVGMDPKYLVTAMKAYVTGQRKHPIKKGLFSGVGDTELNSIALFYARQVPARAQTPLVGDPANGKTESAQCAGCHGEQGVSTNPDWPSLAGQDAKYTADAIRAYKNGSRSDEVMKGLVADLDEKTINDMASFYAGLRPAQPALPSNAQTVAAKREPVLISNGLVSSLDDSTINNIASYYAGLRPEQPSLKNGAQNASKREPVVIRNGLVAGLNGRTINNVVSYYASLRPGQPETAQAPKNVPAVVLRTAPPDGYSLGGIISFRKDDPARDVEADNAICLGCHDRGQRTYWHASVHQERALACADCHTVMHNVSARGQLKTRFEPETCFQCHQDRRAQMFRPAHMPMREGKVVCSDCHNPHGTATEALLWENSVNDNCYKCHAEKRGPFLFEHAPVRENCLACHSAHGSINQYSLKISPPRLCFECHTMGHGTTAGPGSRFAMSRACTNCHSLIHGSNAPNGAAFQR